MNNASQIRGPPACGRAKGFPSKPCSAFSVRRAPFAEKNMFTFTAQTKKT
jgi:hypothetical protein